MLAALTVGITLAGILWPVAGTRLDRPNLLVVVIDDLGVDKVASFGAAQGPATPRLDALADEGVRFTRFTTEPTCSATRASLLTGRHPHRTGVGTALGPTSRNALAFEETTLAELLGAEGYDTAAVGKWHLGSHATSLADNALRHGFGWHAGTVGNLGRTFHSHRRDQGYFRWEKTTNGTLEMTTGYATADTTTDAIGRIESLSAPWFLWVAFHAGHEPLHFPPGIEATGPEPLALRQYDAMIENVDRHLGRILDAMTPTQREQTIVVVLGDNGTPAHTLLQPVPTKGTVFEGGIRAPLVVAGPGVSVGTSGALVQATDLFATVAALTHTSVDASQAQDSISFAPLLAHPTEAGSRTVAYAEGFKPLGHGPYKTYRRMVSDGRYKLIQRMSTTDALFDLDSPAGERENLLGTALSAEATAAHERLRDALPFEMPTRGPSDRPGE